jgi:type II secretory pathway component GspD/PulD (secretin)
VSCSGRVLVLFLVLTILGAGPAAVGAVEERTSEVYPLGIADQGAALELVLAVLSDSGRAVLEKGKNSLVVLDTPEVHARVKAILADLQIPAGNVKVESRIVDRESGQEGEFSSTGQLILTFPGPSATGTVHFNVDHRQVSKSRVARQFVVVVSGAEASIAVGREIPFQRWLYDYCERRGLITRTVEWKEVGSRLLVRPTVVDGGRKVRLHVVPELEYFTGSGRRKKRQAIAFIGIATEVVVPAGEEVRIGGSEENDEFYSRFLVGYDRQRRVREVDIYVRATVLGSGGEGARP